MKIKLPIFFGIVLLLFGLIVIERFDLYYRFIHLDTLMHFIGGFIVAWFVYGLFAGRIQYYSKLQVFALFVASIFVIGWLWELAEYLSSIYSPIYAPIVAHYFHGGDIRDTLTDVFIGDLFGTILFFILYLAWLNRPKA